MAERAPERGRMFPPGCGQDSPPSPLLRPSEETGPGRKLPLLSFQNGPASFHAPPWPPSALEPEGGLGISSAFALAGPRPHRASLSLGALLTWAQLSLLRPSLDTEP